MTDTKDDPSQFSCPYSAGVELEHVLSKAEALIERADLEEALELLTVAEKRYVRAAKLFDLLGDVLLRCDRIEEGVRYKTLHEVLKGTFRIATDEAAVCASRTSKHRRSGPRRRLADPADPAKVLLQCWQRRQCPLQRPRKGGRVR